MGANSPTRHRPGSLRGRALRYAAVAGLVPFVLLAVGAYAWQRSAVIDDAHRNLESIAAVQEARVTDYLEDALEVADLVSTRGRIVERLASPETSDPMQARSTLIGAVTGIPSLHSVSLYDTTGTLVTQEGGYIPIESDLASHLAGPTVGRVFDSAELGSLLALTHPVVFEGVTVGFVAIAFEAETLQEISASYTGLGDTGETIIAAAGSGGDAHFLGVLRFDGDATRRTVGAHESTVPIIDALSGIEGVKSDAIDYRGKEVFAVTRHIDLAGWGLVAKMDRSEVLDPLNDRALLIGFGLALAAALNALLALLFARRVGHEVSEIRDAAVAIRGGDRDQRVRTDVHDELAGLAQAFNSMTDELITLTGDLEGRVALRTAELAETNDRLRRLIEEKETFVATVSHELRTPLTAVLGFIDLLREDSVDPEERQELLEVAARQAGELSDMIEDLLVAARARAGSLRVQSQTVDLSGEVERALEGVDSDRPIDTGGLSGGVLATGDPARVRQVVRNLLSNAIRYGGAGIHVFTETDGSRATVRVVDDGDGIAEDDRERLFGAYERGVGTDAAIGSIGLGLHISRRLAEMMDGTLEYHNDGTSVFTLTLPAVGQPHTFELAALNV